MGTKIRLLCNFYLLSRGHALNPYLITTRLRMWPTPLSPHFSHLSLSTFSLQVSRELGCIQKRQTSLCTYWKSSLCQTFKNNVFQTSPVQVFCLPKIKSPQCHECCLHPTRFPRKTALGHHVFLVLRGRFCKNKQKCIESLYIHKYINTIYYSQSTHTHKSPTNTYI